MLSEWKMLKHLSLLLYKPISFPSLLNSMIICVIWCTWISLIFIKTFCLGFKSYIKFLCHLDRKCFHKAFQKKCFSSLLFVQLFFDLLAQYANTHWLPYLFNSEWTLQNCSRSQRSQARLHKHLWKLFACRNSYLRDPIIFSQTLVQHLFLFWTFSSSFLLWFFLYYLYQHRNFKPLILIC